MSSNVKLSLVAVRSRSVTAAVLTLALALATYSAPARAQSPEALDRTALEHFHNLDVDAARAALDRAIAASTTSPAPLRARLLVHRGVVALAGQGNRQQATEDFMAALGLDPAARVDPDLSTPEVQSAFELARQRVARGATTPPVTTPPVTTPPVTTPPVTTPPVTTPPVTTPPVTTPPATTPPVTTPPTTTPSETEPTVTEPESASTGRLVGDACAATTECGDGLACEEGICTPPAEAFVEPTEPGRFFFQFGYGFGAGWASANMEADSTVPYYQPNKPATWNDSVNGPYAPPGYSEAQWQNVQLATYGGFEVPGAAGTGGTLVSNPDCDVPDGHYCVRVTNPGLSPVGGMRLLFGYWITSRIGASMEWRVQTHAGLGTFSRIMGSARVHYRFTPPRATGLSVDAFAGFGFGQIQLRPQQGHYRGPNLCEQGAVNPGERCDDPAFNATPSGAYLMQGAEVLRPWIQTGPFSVQLGATLNYHFTRTLGVFARPTVYVLFPATTFAMELTLGAEVAF